MKLEVLRGENISKIYCQNAVSLQALRSVSVICLQKLSRMEEP